MFMKAAQRYEFSGHISSQMAVPVFTTTVFCNWDSNVKPFACDVNALTDFATAAAYWQQVRMSLVLGDDHYKRMPRVTVRVAL